MADLFSPLFETREASSVPQELARKPRSTGRPSNDVYARVGDPVLRTARNGVRGGMKPENIIRQIATDHAVHLSLGDLRLLLASRRIQDRETPSEMAGHDGGTPEEMPAPSP